jgi:hypothetical protein
MHCYNSIEQVCNANGFRTKKSTVNIKKKDMEAIKISPQFKSLTADVGLIDQHPKQFG